MAKSVGRSVPPYRERIVDAALQDVLTRLPAVWLVGPRASGKTTSAQRQAASVVHLDRPDERVLFEADPDAALRDRAEPVLLDEWQEVPGVLGAIKRSVDADAHPGRFILTGSVNATLDVNTWPATGRVVRMPVFPMTQREIADALDAGPSFVERLWAARLDAFAGAKPAPDVRGYLAMALHGGFPDAALNRDDVTAQLWFANYVDELVHRDAALVRHGVDAGRFAAFAEAVAANTAGVVGLSTLLEACRIDRRTASVYWNMLQDLFVAEAMRAWWSSRLTRLVATEKRYLVDGGLAAAVLRLTPDVVEASADWVGRLLDTWVVAQLRPEIAMSPRRPRLHHLRTKGGEHEVDVLVEFGGGVVAGIEIKATSAPARNDARHLRWLRDQLGDRFRVGVVLHTGPYAIELDDRIVAAPMSTLWA